MIDSLGDEVPRSAPHVFRKAARYLVIIDAAGAMTARLFDDTRQPLADFDAASEEVAVMTAGLTPARNAGTSAWDAALRSHSAAERAAADVYTLDV